MLKQLRDKGQATIEYILLFSFLAFILVNFVNSLGKMVGTSVGSLGYALTQQLSVGVCKTYCYYDGYQNKGAE
ncbi:MAG: Flp pilus assembly pilin Flp [Bacteriovoracaceae bacterium]|jgi:Flp pilus assembly pilin Flp